MVAVLSGPPLIGLAIILLLISYVRLPSPLREMKLTHYPEKTFTYLSPVAWLP
jgi:hypothetical protein